MSPIRPGRATVTGVSAAELAERCDALQEALYAGGAQLDPDAAAQADQVVDKVGARLSLLGGHTVVALAGATGSGKSSLFNEIVGSPVAQIGVRRPTTSRPTAATWGAEPAGALLDWLDIDARHVVDQTSGGHAGSLDGLVLLDLPDFDSRDLEHRREAERVLELVDVFVWVTDPQKYADARLHDDYVSALSAHDAVTIVVLNQTDRLGGDGVQQILPDLRRLLVQDGLNGVQVVATSVRTGDGVDELRQRLANVVAGANAARTRLAGDIRLTAQACLAGVADTESRITKGHQRELLDALAVAAGVPTIVDAVRRDYTREATGRTGWPLTRWTRRLRPSPLRRLRLDHTAADTNPISPDEVREVLGRSSLPPPPPSAKAGVDLATRRLATSLGEPLPPRWSQAIADAATPDSDDLSDALDRAVLDTPLRSSDPRWWSAVGVVQLLLALTAALAVAWLLVVMAFGWLQLPELPMPMVGPLALPFVMLVVGLVGGILLAALSAFLARIGARRRGQAVRERLVDSIAGVANSQVLTPVNQVVERHARCRDLLEAARG